MSRARPFQELAQFLTMLKQQKLARQYRKEDIAEERSYQESQRQQGLRDIPSGVSTELGLPSNIGQVTVAELIDLIKEAQTSKASREKTKTEEESYMDLSPEVWDLIGVKQPVEELPSGVQGAPRPLPYQKVKVGEAVNIGNLAQRIREYKEPPTPKPENLTLDEKIFNNWRKLNPDKPWSEFYKVRGEPEPGTDQYYLWQIAQGLKTINNFPAEVQTRLKKFIEPTQKAGGLIQQIAQEDPELAKLLQDALPQPESLRVR